MAGQPARPTGPFRNVVTRGRSLASVGQTEEEARRAAVGAVGCVPPSIATARARAMGEREGRSSIIADARLRRLLGAHISGPRASDLIAELTLALEFGASARTWRAPSTPTRTTARPP